MIKLTKQSIKFINKLYSQKAEKMKIDKSNLKVFGRWSVEGIEVEDPGLKAYIDLTPKIVPKTHATYAGQRFQRSKTFIVERLINKLMVTGHQGKKHKRTSGHHTGNTETIIKEVIRCFEIIEKKLKQNPIYVLVKAIENAAPREEVTSIEYGGARYPKPVEVAPQRRVDLALRFMTQGAYTAAFRSKKKLGEALADEIINAFNMDTNSLAISKKIELERQADAAR